jgi:hypothetical protein
MSLVPAGEVTRAQLRRELRVAGRRQHLHRWVALAISLTGILVIVGSSLPWTYYWPGGDTAPLNLSGLTFPSEWGVWTLMIGAGMIVGALLAMGLVSPYRYLLVAFPAVAGLSLSVVSSVRRVPLDIGISIRGSVDVGLGLVLGSCGIAVAIAAAAGIVDWRWRRDEPVLVGSSSSMPDRARAAMPTRGRGQFSSTLTPVMQVTSGCPRC